MKFSDILTILLAENCAMAQPPPPEPLLLNDAPPPPPPLPLNDAPPPPAPLLLNDGPQPTCEETCKKQCEADEVTTAPPAAPAPTAPTPEVETTPAVDEGKAEEEVPGPKTDGDITPPPAEGGKEETITCMGIPLNAGETCALHCDYDWCKDAIKPENFSWTCVPVDINDEAKGCRNRNEGDNTTPPVEEAKGEEEIVTIPQTEIDQTPPPPVEEGKEGGGGTYGGGRPGPQIRGPGPQIIPGRPGPITPGGGGTYGGGRTGQPQIRRPRPALPGRPGRGGGTYGGGRPGQPQIRRPRPALPRPTQPGGGGRTACKHTSGVPNKSACYCKGQLCGVGWQCSPKRGCKKGNGTECNSDQECFWGDCKKMVGMPSKCC